MEGSDKLNIAFQRQAHYDVQEKGRHCLLQSAGLGSSSRQLTYIPLAIEKLVPAPRCLPQQPSPQGARVGPV